MEENKQEESPQGSELKTLVVIDGANFMFRAYHAMKAMNNNLSAPDGTPTAALLSFSNMVKKAKEESKADAVAIIFESTTGTFRDGLADDYKGTRKPTPDEVKIQMNLARDLFPLMGVPVLWADGFEADDLLCAFGAHAPEGWKVVMASSDKDLAQVIGPKVSQLDINGWKKLDEAAVVAKFGVGPDKIAQYLALMGDAVDNIAGVDKVGDKTASKLLNAYGSIAGIYENLDKLTPAIRRGFEEARERIPVLMKMTTAAIDVPLPMSHDEIFAANRNPDWGKALEMLRPLGLRALIAKAEKGVAALEARAQRLGSKP
jgi:DNA polymerase-1